MSQSVSSNRQEEEASTSEGSQRSLLGFVLFSMIEEAVIGVIALILIILFFPQFLILGVICIVVGLIIFTLVKIRLYSTSYNLPVDDLLIGKTAIALEDFRMKRSNHWEGTIRVQGETWRAESKVSALKGDALQVTAIAGLRLQVMLVEENA